MDRFCYVISKSKYCNNLILKGGFLITKIQNDFTRTTKDIDLDILNETMDLITIDNIIDSLNESANNELGISIRKHSIRKQNKNKEYNGYSITLECKFIEKANIKCYINIDLSTGDKITPLVNEIEIKTFDNKYNFKMLSSNYETMIAEKLHALYVLESSNYEWRYKDIRDLKLFIDFRDKLGVSNNIVLDALIYTILL